MSVETIWGTAAAQNPKSLAGRVQRRWGRVQRRLEKVTRHLRYQPQHWVVLDQRHCNLDFTMCIFPLHYFTKHFCSPTKLGALYCRPFNTSATVFFFNTTCSPFISGNDTNRYLRHLKLWRQRGRSWGKPPIATIFKVVENSVDFSPCTIIMSQIMQSQQFVVLSRNLTAIQNCLLSRSVACFDLQPKQSESKIIPSTVLTTTYNDPTQYSLYSWAKDLAAWWVTLLCFSTKEKPCIGSTIHQFQLSNQGCHVEISKQVSSLRFLRGCGHKNKDTNEERAIGIRLQQASWPASSPAF